MQAIVIATTPDSVALPTLLGSLEGYSDYPILILSDYTFELGKIKFIINHTDIDEFVFLQDSCEVKDPNLFEMVFSSPRSVSFSASPNSYGSYLGKYQRDVLLGLDIPTITNKQESVQQEVDFNTLYANRTYVESLEPPLKNTDAFIEKWGKTVMVLENQWLIKYKSCWNRNQLT